LRSLNASILLSAIRAPLSARIVNDRSQDMSLTLERRRHARLPVERPCKVFHHPSRTYLAASTCDLSESGAMIRVDNPRALNPGDEIDVLIAWSTAPVLQKSRAITGSIVRVPGSFARHQFIAVKFAKEMELALAA